MVRVLEIAGGLRRVLLVVGVLLAFVPAAAGARVQMNKEYCFCITPRNNQAASGMSKAGNPSTVKIRWRGTNYMDMPAAGDTATAIMTRLRNAVAAANPGDTVGPVTTNPMTGRAVFCVMGPAGGVGLPDARETDCNFKECTFSQVSGPNDPFLRGVLGAFLAAEFPQGGDVVVSVDVQQPIGNHQTVSVQVQTNQPGDLNQRVVMALDATGLDASLALPYILIDRGAFAQVDGVGVVSNDLGIGTLEVGHQSLSAAVPTLSGFGLACLVLLALAGGGILLRKAH